ncbi:MAG: hypothetical protein ABI727_06885, partial [Nitrosospira sp.]
MDDQSLTRFCPEYPGPGYDVSAASGNLPDASNQLQLHISHWHFLLVSGGRRDELFDQSAKKCSLNKKNKNPFISLHQGWPVRQHYPAPPLS